MICFELIVCALISLVVVLWSYNKWNRRHFEKLAAIMTGPPSYPIVGTGLEFIGTPEQIFETLIKLVDDYGPNPFKLWMGSKFTVVLAKPEDMQIVLNSSKALEKDQFYRFFKKTLGEGLLTAQVPKWKKHRRIISPVFNANMKQFFPVFNEKIQILIEKLKKEVGRTETFDMWDYMAPTQVDMICQTAMGYNLDTQSNSESEFSHAWIKTSEMDSMRIYKPWLYPEFLFDIYTKLTGLDKMYTAFIKLPNQIIKEKKETFAKKKSNGDDATDTGEEIGLKVFLDTLLELNEAGANFSDDEIRDEVVTMMIAGSETNAITLCFCILMLAIHQDIQNKVYDEIYEIFGDGDDIITIEDTSKLIYTDQVIKETLRLYSIVPVILRQLQDDVKISTDGLVLPKGTTCVLSTVAMHHSPDLYPDPWAFNPEHFNAENVAKRHRYSYLPFSGGPRGCVGSKYAMLSIKALLSMFLRNYSVNTHIKLTDIKLKVDVLTRSTNGYPMTIQLRDRRPTLKQN